MKNASTVILWLTVLLAACDNPLERTTREQLRGPLAQNVQYAIDDLLRASRAGIDCDWVRREADGLRARADSDTARDEVAQLRARVAAAGCLVQ